MRKKFSLSVFLASCFGAGFSLIVPGAVGAAVGIGAYMLVKDNLSAYNAAIIIAACVGFLVSGKAEHILGRKDPKPVVIDEFLGTLIAFYMIPQKFLYLAAAFVLFRIFDVFKPYPARRMEKLPGSAGIMLDDIFAAVYANLVVQVALRLFL